MEKGGGELAVRQVAHTQSTYVWRCTCACVLYVPHALGPFPHVLDLPPLLLQVRAVVTNLPCHLIQDGGKPQLAEMQPRLCAPKVGLQEEVAEGEGGESTYIVALKQYGRLTMSDQEGLTWP